MSWVVADLMTRDVVAVEPTTSIVRCVGLIRMHGVGALPVVSRQRVVGIVSLTDLVLKGDLATAHRRGDRTDTTSRKDELTAANLMTRDVITAYPDTPLSAAVRQMFQRRIDRLPVVDYDGRMVGIVSRSDVLRMFLRSDVAIRREVANTVAADMPFIGKGRILADVHDGVVTLDGEVEAGTFTDVLLRLVASVPGVMGVKSHLKVRRDSKRKSVGSRPRTA